MSLLQLLEIQNKELKELETQLQSSQKGRKFKLSEIKEKIKEIENAKIKILEQIRAELANTQRKTNRQTFENKKKEEIKQNMKKLRLNRQRIQAALLNRSPRFMHPTLSNHTTRSNNRFNRSNNRFNRSKNRHRSSKYQFPIKLENQMNNVDNTYEEIDEDDE